MLQTSFVCYVQRIEKEPLHRHTWTHDFVHKKNQDLLTHKTEVVFYSEVLSLYVYVLIPTKEMP
jgi:hypothetical protein